MISGVELGQVVRIVSTKALGNNALMVYPDFAGKAPSFMAGMQSAGNEVRLLLLDSSSRL